MSDGPTLIQRCGAEMVGTFALTFGVGCNVLFESHYNAALSIGVTLMVLVYMFGRISGAQLNPAVTLAVKLADDAFSWGDVAPYWLAQITGAVLANLALGPMTGNTLGPIAAGNHFSWLEAGVVEMIFTCMLCTVILGVAVSPKAAGKEYFGMAIGFALCAGVYAGAHVSGAVYNPAIAIACDLVNLFSKGASCFVWILFQLAGAAIAAFIYKYMKDNEDMGRFVAEFMGTFFLCSTVGFAISAKISAYTTLAAATALAANIWCFGPTSGGHLNPAVSFAILCSGRGKIDAMTCVKYMASQILGGMAAFTIHAFVSGHAHKVSEWHGHSFASHMFVEALFTAKLAFVVLTIATVHDNKIAKHMFGLIIGFCVFVAVPGILNPAVAFGLDFGSVVKGGHMEHCFYVILAQLVGGALAGGLFGITHEFEYSNMPPMK